MCRDSAFKGPPMVSVMCSLSAVLANGPPTNTVMCKCSLFSKGTSTATVKLEKCVAILSFNCYVSLALSSQLSVLLKLCIMNVLLLHFPICQSCHIVSGTYRRVARKCLNMKTSSEGLLFSLASGPSTLIYYFLVWRVTVEDTFAQCHHKNSAIQAL